MVFSKFAYNSREVTLGGRPGLRQDITFPDSRMELLVGVKGWLSRNFQGGRIYKETLGQLPMTRLIDLDMALPKSRSLRILEHAVIELIKNRNIAEFICLCEERGNDSTSP